ncbi:hypothetical protein, partial [Candidatus Entotheonella palauensis]|uniref:hypothetical protein n=1 Tax=Candidatus Entotheonella palauensis TaxID=93172 RepID=UPI001C4E0D9F
EKRPDFYPLNFTHKTLHYRFGNSITALITFFGLASATGQTIIDDILAHQFSFMHINQVFEEQIGMILSTYKDHTKGRAIKTLKFLTNITVLLILNSDYMAYSRWRLAGDIRKSV